ncbi:unnamed protein product [Parnassius apollo]|uniref:(apollo) hypothetical protein n=1 Tax=Parnassius apollo TaxID=110799 RepID=A0A8S3W0X2_PARAO|nr:unnamed protein product [Parnassius apollo]
MTPSWIVLSVALICVAEYATGNLIRGKSDGAVFATKDVPVPLDDVDGNNLSIPVEGPTDPELESSTKKCGEIGTFCMNHSDCCSFACLGFLKKCVSGSG